ncbi:hypothetical protein WCE14_09270 [Acinetobacter schindleri]|uniref:hypothetical protein n=1 Tax=Acinetobacter schindleri TaxID=108981 RepID=UPI0034D47B4A
MTSLASTDIFSAVLSDAAAEKPKTITRARHDRENPYTLLSNKLLRDKTIKHSDRGLMAQLLSWSDHHRLCIQAVVKSSLEGRDAIRGMIDRLIVAGYIRMTRTKAENGQFDSVTYQIFEESTGAVVADLDLTGIVENSEEISSPQLDLFAFEESAVIDQKSESVKPTTNGKAVNGKPDTNNNYETRNTIFNTNNADSENSEKQCDQGTLLRKWPLKLEDPAFTAKLGMAGLSGRITSQEHLDRFLIDFNQQHDKYKNVHESKRLHNFTVYLIRVLTSGPEYAKHVARMRALGFNLAMPPKRQSQKQEQIQSRIQQQQAGCNPFEVVQTEVKPLSDDFKNALKGF